METNTPQVSVIVPTYRREEVLCDTLDHLAALSHADYELIVVDQTPQHREETGRYLEELAARLPGRYRYIHLDSPGLPRARNIGAREARGDYLLYCDDDIVPPRDLIEMHLRNFAEPDVGAVTGGIRVETVRMPPQTKPCVILPNGRLLQYWEHQVARGETDSLIGCNMSVPRALALEVGLFDEGYIGKANWEETDFSFRIRRRGYRLVYDPGAAVVHLGHVSGGVRASKDAGEGTFLYESHYNNAYFFRRQIPQRHLPAFLKREIGYIVVKRGLGRGRLDLIGPSLRGLWDGYRAGGRPGPP